MRRQFIGVVEQHQNWLSCYDAICCSDILNMKHWRCSPELLETKPKRKLNQWNGRFSVSHISFGAFAMHTAFGVLCVCMCVYVRMCSHWQKTLMPEAKIKNKMAFSKSKWAGMYSMIKSSASSQTDKANGLQSVCSKLEWVRYAYRNGSANPKQYFLFAYVIVCFRWRHSITIHFLTINQNTCNNIKAYQPTNQTFTETFSILCKETWLDRTQHF